MTLAFAYSASPPRPVNKTVTMSWSTSGMATTEDGQQRAYNNLNIRTVYISSAGRTFAGPSAAQSIAQRRARAWRSAAAASRFRATAWLARDFRERRAAIYRHLRPRFHELHIAGDRRQRRRCHQAQGTDGRMYSVTQRPLAVMLGSERQRVRRRRIVLQATVCSLASRRTTT